MLFLDFLLLVMIIVCVVYCWVLNRRIQGLQNSRIEFARMIKELNVSIVKAEANVNEMSQLSKITSTEIKAVVDEAKGSIIELTPIIAMANDVSKMLNEQIKHLQDQDNNEFSSNSYESMIRTKSGEKFSEHDLAELHEEEEAITYTNSLKNFIHKVSKKNEDTQTLNQMSYYDTLRKINAKK